MFGSNVASEALRIGGQMLLNQQSFQQNKRLAAYQNQLNVEQWQRENDYNDPSSQMARLRGAGLNSNLMYGNGTPTATGNSYQMSGTMSGGSPVDPVQASNIGLINAQIDNINADTDLKKQTSLGQSIDNEWKNLFNERDISLKDAQISNLVTSTNVLEETAQKIKEETRMISAQTGKTNEESRSLALDNLFKERTLHLRIQEVSNNLNLQNVQMRSLETGIKKMLSDIALNGVNIRLMSQQAQQILEQMNLTKEQEHMLQVQSTQVQGSNSMMMSKKDPSRFNAYGKVYHFIGMLGQIIGGSASYGVVDKK